MLTRTALRFDSTVRADQTRGLVLGEVAYLPTKTLGLEAGAGVALDGSLETGGATHDFSPGPAAVVGIAFRLLDEPRYFAHLTSQVSAVWSRTQHDSDPSVPYSAYDLRLGGELGLNLAEILHPYLVGRVFGGPVFWRYRGESVTGTDIHHYQLGLGVGIALAGRVALLAEAIPLGEQALSLGLSASL